MTQWRSIVKAVKTAARKEIEWFIGGNISTGAGLSTDFQLPTDCKLVKAYAYAKTGPDNTAHSSTTGTLVLDILKAGTTIFTTAANRLTIAAQATSGSQTTIENNLGSRGDKMTLSVISVPTSTGATTVADLTVVLEFEPLVR